MPRRPTGWQEGGAWRRIGGESGRSGGGRCSSQSECGEPGVQPPVYLRADLLDQVPGCRAVA